MRTLIATAAILLVTYLQAQPIVQAKVGMNSRLMPAVTVDAGIQVNGVVLASTYSWQAFNSIGAYAGYRAGQWSLYAGYGTQDAKGKAMMLGKPWIAGISWHDDSGQGMLDLRWMAGCIQFTMGWNLR